VNGKDHFEEGILDGGRRGNVILCFLWCGMDFVSGYSNGRLGEHCNNFLTAD
jgi:hypothetical protein